MTVTDQQLRALAFLTKACRPNGARRWDEAGILVALEKVRDRSLAEVIMATIRAATDRDIDTPAVIPMPGPHWQAAAVVRTGVTVKTDPANRCGICSESRERCARIWADDHVFEPPHAPPVIDVPRTVAALKDELAPIAPRPDPTGLDALTTRRPELAAAAERIAALNPGLRNESEEVA